MVFQFSCDASRVLTQRFLHSAGIHWVNTHEQDELWNGWAQGMINLLLQALAEVNRCAGPLGLWRYVATISVVPRDGAAFATPFGRFERLTI